MPVAAETTKVIQDKVLKSVQVGQNAVVDVVRSWADTVETVFSRVPEFTLAEVPPKPGQVLESTFNFTERLLAAQRDFASRVIEAALPATRAATSSAANTARGATTPPPTPSKG